MSSVKGLIAACWHAKYYVLYGRARRKLLSGWRRSFFTAVFDETREWALSGNLLPTSSPTLLLLWLTCC